MPEPRKRSTAKLRFRSTIGVHTAPLRVDRQSKTIHGVVAMQANVEALGHGLMSDLKTLEMMVVLASAIPNGVLMRFGHPGASDNAMGYQVARAVNHRIEADSTGRYALVHDAQLIPEASGSPVFSRDPIDYIMNMAESQPQNIGESVVIAVDEVWVMGDGSEEPTWIQSDDGWWEYNDKQEQSIYDLPVMRPVSYHNVDFVMEGALTHNGLFAKMFSGTGHQYAHAAFEFVDQWREQFGIPLENVPHKVNAVLGQYLQERGADSFKVKSMPTDENEVEVNGAETENEGDQLSAIFDETDSILDELEADSTDESTDESGDAPNTGEFAAHVAARFNTQNAQIVRLAQQYGRIARQIQHLSRRQNSLEESHDVSILNGQSGLGAETDNAIASLQRVKRSGKPSKSLAATVGGFGQPLSNQPLTPQQRAVEAAKRAKRSKGGA